MRTNRKNIHITFQFIAILGFLVAGCKGEDVEKDSQLALIKTTNPAPQTIGHEHKEKELVEKVKKDVMSFEEIYDVAVVKGKEDILVAYKVKHLQRFRMKQIEKKINKLLEDHYPDDNFTVSSDYKIFLEAVQLNEQMKDPNYSDKKAEDRLKRIISLKQELT